MFNVEELKKKFYPDPSKDGTLIFYNWIREYSKKDYVVLNFGAGREVDRRVRSLNGEVRKVIGVDVDECVLNNKDLDEAYVIENDTLPFPDNFFDMAIADFVVEHLQEPMPILKEIIRVMKPSSSFFFRTPNKFHYVSMIAKATPHWFHKLVANRVRNLPNDSHEPHQTFYRLNSTQQILSASRLVGFKNIEIRLVEAEPSYLVFHPFAFLLGVTYERLVNCSNSLSFLRANILCRLEK